jgi:hypothetical protein
VLCFGAKPSVDKKKVESIIVSVGLFVKEHPNYSKLPDTTKKRLAVIIDGLNEMESLEAQNILMATSDLHEINYTLESGKVTEAEVIKFMTYEYIQNRLLGFWDKQKRNMKDVLMLKIMPVITNDKYNQNLRASFISNADDYMNNIHNKKIPITDSDRNIVMDTMLKIFTDETKQLNMRCAAARLWSWSERRPQIFQQNIKYIENNEKLLAASAQKISHNRTMTDDLLFEKLLKLLETNKNEKTVESILYGLNSLSYEKPERIAKVKNMKEQLLLKEGYKHLKKVYGKL